MTQSDSRVEIDDLSYLGRNSERLSDLIAEQAAELFAREGVRIPVKSNSLVETLSKCEPASASDLASRMGRSHQIVGQKLPKLIRLGLIERYADPDDSRRFLHRLTPDGHEQLALLGKLTPRIAAAYREIEEEIGPVFAQILAAIRMLETVSLADRLGSTERP